jgi:hypothetical protein
VALARPVKVSRRAAIVAIPIELRRHFMGDLERYLEEIVGPTIREFEEHPFSVRHAFLACVATFHAVDYMAHPRRSRPLREQWRNQSSAFARVDKVAHAFKHVTNGYDNSKLEARSIVSRPPAIAGVMRCGLSVHGDTEGAVTFRDDPTVNILESVRDAFQFLNAQILKKPGSDRSGSHGAD